MMFSRSRDYDVAVVGAGPAGSSTAIRLSQAGLNVLLVEQKQFPREKLCGEFISPECIGQFNALGVMPDIQISGGRELVETVFFARNGKSVAVQSEWFGNLESRALGLSRAALDQVLRDRAGKAGAEVRMETAAAGLLFDKERVAGVKLKGKNGGETEVSCGLVIDATGRTRSLARRLDPTNSKKKPAKIVAFKTHLRGASVAPNVCEIYAYRGGYGGCNRVENGLYNVCFIASAIDTKQVGSDAERVLREIVFSNKRAAESMSKAEVVKPWLAVPIERFGRGDLVPADGLLAIGDAAAFIDPFTGSGILLALESGKIAASAITNAFRDNSSFEDLAAKYKQNYSSVFDRRLRICSVLRHVSFVPFWAEATISLLSLSVSLRRRIARATR